MQKELWEQMKNKELLKKIAAQEEVFWLNENLEEIGRAHV